MNRLIFCAWIGVILAITIPDGSRNVIASTTVVIVVMVLLSLYVLFFFNDKHCQKSIKNYRWIWVCLLSWLFITGAQTMEVFGYSNYDKYASLRELILYLGYVSCLFLTLCLLHNVKRIQIIIIVFLTIAVGQTIFGFINYFSGPGSTGWIPTHWASHQVTGTFINRNFYANLIVLCIGMASIPIIIQRRSRTGGLNQSADSLNQLAIQLCYFLTTIVLLSGVMMSRSRGGLVSLVIALGFALVLGFVCKSAILNIARLVVAGAASIVLFGFELMQSRLSAGLVDISRIKQWKATMELIWDKWIAGYGPGSYEEAYRSNIPFDASPLTHNHAHNDYLELLLEQGVLGSLPLLCFIALVFYYGFKNLIVKRSFTQAKIVISALVGIIGMLAHGMFDFPFQVPSNVIFFLILIAIVLASAQLKFEPKRVRSPH